MLEISLAAAGSSLRSPYCCSHVKKTSTTAIVVGRRYLVLTEIQIVDEETSASLPGVRVDFGGVMFL